MCIVDTITSSIIIDNNYCCGSNARVAFYVTVYCFLRFILNARFPIAYARPSSDLEDVLNVAYTIEISGLQTTYLHQLVQYVSGHNSTGDALAYVYIYIIYTNGRNIILPRCFHYFSNP